MLYLIKVFSYLHLCTSYVIHLCITLQSYTYIIKALKYKCKNRIVVYAIKKNAETISTQFYIKVLMAIPPFFNKEIWHHFKLLQKNALFSKIYEHLIKRLEKTNSESTYFHIIS